MMQYGKNWLLLSFLPLLAVISLFGSGCRSDAYYQDRAVQRARSYLLENAEGLDAEQLYFIKFNRPVLLTGTILPAENLGVRANDLQQVCVTWRLPGSDEDWLVYGASSGSMSHWYPNRAIKKKFQMVARPIHGAMSQSRAYMQNYLFDNLSVAEFNRVRFEFPYVIETNFPMVLNPAGNLPADEVEAAQKKLETLSQLTLAWPLNNEEEYIIFCGHGKSDLSGWAINFAGKMKKSDLNDATVKVLRTPSNAQTPFEEAQ